MEKESIHVGTEPAIQDKSKIKMKESPVSGGGMSAETKLLIANLVLFFIAANVWGYYFYKKGFFGVSADIPVPTQVERSASPTISPEGPEKADSVFMLPGV